MSFKTMLCKFEKTNLENVSYISDLRSYKTAQIECGSGTPFFYDEIIEEDEFNRLPAEIQSICQKKTLIKKELDISKLKRHYNIPPNAIFEHIMPLPTDLDLSCSSTSNEMSELSFTSDWITRKLVYTLTLSESELMDFYNISEEDCIVVRIILEHAGCNFYDLHAIIEWLLHNENIELHMGEYQKVTKEIIKKANAVLDMDLPEEDDLYFICG